MEPTNVTFGITLGIMAGLLLGSFALPMKKIRTWQWEHTWIMFSLWGTIVLPLLLALITVPSLWEVYTQTPASVLITVFLFGAGWGVANVGYGMGLKMVGLALGTALVLGLNNAIGAIMPIILYHPEQVMQPVGMVLLAGVLVMLVGIIVCAVAGLKREKAMNVAQDSKKENPQFVKGLIICLIAGTFGALFNFALIFGKPMEPIAVNAGATPLNASNPTWVIALSGGFVASGHPPFPYS